MDIVVCAEDKRLNVIIGLTGGLEILDGYWAKILAELTPLFRVIIPDQKP